MAKETLSSLTSLNDKSYEIKMPCRQEWIKLHSFFPESRFTVQCSKFEEIHIYVPFSQENKDYELKFSLTSDYPHEVPDIYIKSSTLSKSEENELIKQLDLVCAGSIGKPMLLLCIEEATNILQTLSSDNQKSHKGKKDLTRKYAKHRKNKSGAICKSKPSDDKMESAVDEKDNSDFINACLTQEDGAAWESNQDDISLVNEAKSLNLRPNFFIALRIWEKSLIQNLINIQNDLVEQEALLTKGIIPPESLHITLCNLGLDTADDLVKAMEALRKMKPDLQAALPMSSLIIHGASQFYDRAIYAKVKENDEFLSFRNIIIRNLEAVEVEFREDHESYTPHVTLIKVRRPERRMFGNRPLRPALYSSFLDCIHGEQKVDAIYLCAMDGNKRDDGFYVTPYELKFKTILP